MLVARTRAAGPHEYYANIPWEYIHTFEGNIVEHYTGTDHVIEASCNRRKASGSLYPLNGTHTIWRDPTEYEQSIYEVERKTGTWSWGGGAHFQTSTAGVSNDPVNDQNPPCFDVRWPGVNWSDYLESESLTKAILKIKDMKAGMGENLGQAKQTASMLVNAGTTLLEAALALKHGKVGRVIELLRDGRSVGKAGANFYLEYRYGWKPLMLDIAGLADLLKEQLITKPLILSGEGYTKEDFTISAKYNFVSTGGGKRSSYTKLYGQVLDPNTRYADRLGLSNPLEIAWELVPYSFVVDWFVPVSDILNALQAPAGVAFIGGFTTQKGTLDAICHEIPSPDVNEETPRTNHHKGWSIRRKPYIGDWPKPGLFAKSPFATFTLSHAAAALALLIQRCRS